MKNTKIKTNHGLIIIIVFIFLFGIVIYLLGNTNKTYVPQTSTVINTRDVKTYSSKSMKFSIDVPDRFHVSDAVDKLTLLDNNKEINIIRNGTDYENISDYIANFDARRNLIASETKTISIGGNEAVSRMVEFLDQNVKQKSYYIYVDNWVYILSTSSESLFPVLDQIAQSFRYTP